MDEHSPFLLVQFTDIKGLDSLDIDLLANLFAGDSLINTVDGLHSCCDLNFYYSHRGPFLYE